MEESDQGLGKVFRILAETASARFPSPEHSNLPNFILSVDHVKEVSTPVLRGEVDRLVTLEGAAPDALLASILSRDATWLNYWLAPAVLRRLFELGADPRLVAVTAGGESMTMAAVAATWGADDFFATLLDSGKVDVSHVGANGNTLLHYLAVRPGYVPSVLNLLPGDIAAAIAAGVDAAQTNQHGESPLRTLESIIAAGGFQGGENFDPGTAAPAIWEAHAVLQAASAAATLPGGGGWCLGCWNVEVAGTKNCARCKKVRYCSGACQKKHWKFHKKSCAKLERPLPSPSMPLPPPSMAAPTTAGAASTAAAADDDLKCPICLVNPESLVRYQRIIAQCFSCGQLYCSDCFAPEKLSRNLRVNCVVCSATLGASDLQHAQRLEALLQGPVLPGRRTQAAMFNLVSLLKEGLGVPQNTSEADRLTLASAEAGYVHAQRSLGQMCLERRRPADAAKWFRLAAEQGCAIAQNQLGNLCDDGIGVQRSSKDAVRWWWAAAAQGHPVGQFNLACSYQTGKGVARNETEAVAWYTKAAQNGHDLAQVNLAKACFEGFGGIPQSNSDGVKWLQRAAKQGAIDAQFQLGAMYYQGVSGVTQNLAEAAMYLRMAASSGSAEDQDRNLLAKINAQVMLADMCRKGEGMAPDPAEAVKWYELAGDQGNAGAQYNAGAVYLNGALGVQKDLGKARHWFLRAAAAGIPQATHGLQMVAAEEQKLTAQYPSGIRVQITGLTAAAHFNGRLGTVVQPTKPLAAGRIAVRMDGQTKSMSLSRDNVVPS